MRFGLAQKIFDQRRVAASFCSSNRGRSVQKPDSSFRNDDRTDEDKHSISLLGMTGRYSNSMTRHGCSHQFRWP